MKKQLVILKNLGITTSMVTLMLASGVTGAVMAGHAGDNRQIQLDQAVLSQGIEMVSAPVASTSELSLPDLFEGANPAVVAISTEITGRNAFGGMVTRPSSGSGFLVSSDGYIVTNDHVIEGASQITVLLADGQELPAQVVGRDPATDLAVIKIMAEGLPYLSFGDSNDVRVGTQVVAIGNPLGELANSMTTGIVSALDRYVNVEGNTQVKLQTDAAINRGNSGGPLLNLQGEVIGVVSAKTIGSGIEGLGFAIPAEEASRVVNELITYRFVRGRAALGVQVTHGQNNGIVQIMELVTGGAAQRAGLQVGDRILAAGGETIKNFSDLRRVLDDAKAGETIEVSVERDGAQLEMRVTLDEFIPVS